MVPTTGIHHITAITGDPQKCLDFYEGFLGQRLVKQTVNFDDPRSYHFYFGDEPGTPGTLITFFYFGPVQKGARGTGEVSAIQYGILKDAKEYWLNRAYQFGIEAVVMINAFGQEMVQFHDSDGIEIQLVLIPAKTDVTVWHSGDITESCALQGFYGATLTVLNTADMQPVLEGLGYEKKAEAGLVTRYCAKGLHGTYLDIHEAPDLLPARQGTGSVHHIALRAADDAAELEMRAHVAGIGLSPTPVIDRQYFHSVYFMTPGQILFEIATDQPGFAVDEHPDRLGETLVLPPQYEPYRDQIVKQLVPITVPRHKRL